MASVALEFVAPGQPDIVELKIWESTTKDGVYSEIDSTTSVGTYPDYINHFTTDNASADDNWFSIQWIDSKGAESDLSEPWQGGVDSVVGQVADRVIQRGVSIDESVVIQEAEAVAEEYFKKDPYTVELPVSYRTLAGLTYVTMARVLMMQSVQGSEESFTAGLVSMKSGSSQDNQKAIENLLKLAAGFLGLNYTVVAQMAEIKVAGGTTQIVSEDISRLIVEVDV